MDQIREAILDAKDFFQEVETCHFSLRQEDLEFSKGVKNLDKINREVLNSNLPSTSQIEFKQCTKQGTLDYATSILHNLYNGMYDSYIETLLPIFRVDRSMVLYDAAIAGDYDIETMKKEYDQGIIYSLKSSYSPIALSHESTHAIIGSTIQPGFNPNYNELCPIFADYYAALQMDEKIGNDHLGKIKIIRLNHLKKACIEFMNVQNYVSEFQRPNDQLTPMQLAFKYSYYNSYQYIIGTIFSSRLFDIFLDQKTEVLQDFQKVAAHEIQIPDLLGKYNISLRDFETVSSFQKELKHFTQ